jgi:hypothetical protein
MMEGEPGYEDSWTAAKAAVLVRPTSPTELLDWLNDKSHSGDAPCAGACEVNGTRMRVVRVATGRYELIPD